MLASRLDTGSINSSLPINNAWHAMAIIARQQNRSKESRTVDLSQPQIHSNSTAKCMPQFTTQTQPADF